MVAKKVAVRLLGEAKDEYLMLKQTVALEQANGVVRSFHQTILDSINSKIEILKQKYDYGTHLPRSQIPKKYLLLYEVTNLWKVELAGYWRMIYTLRQPTRGEAEVEVLDIWLDIVDIIDHPKYDKIFGYRKK